LPSETRAASAGRRLRLAAAVLVVALAACSRTSTSASPRKTSSPPSTDPTPSSISSPRHNPSKVAIWGDSLALQAHDALREQGRVHGLNVVVQAFYGLAPCDVAGQFLRDLESSLDALVIAFTGNNLTPCMEQSGQRMTGSAYYEAYRRDVSGLVAATVARKVPVLVVGAPAFPARKNVPDRVELNRVLREVADAHPGAEYVDSWPHVSPDGFTNTLPCLPGETAALGCDSGRITVRAGNGVHFDEPRAVPCPDGRVACRFTAGGHRFANAIYAGLAAVKGLSYVPAPPTVAVPDASTGAR
jgi:hypothetical protein